MSAMRQLVWPGLAFVVGTLSAFLLRAVALTAIRRWARDASVLRAVGDAIRIPSLLWCLVLGLYLATEVALEFSRLTLRLRNQLGTLLEAAVILSMTLTLAGLVDTLIGRGPVPRVLGGAVTGLAQTTFRIAVLVVGLLVLLSALGVHITPILTALGVGGLAVALALQDTLANLFAGMHLLADRPIRVGDYVKVGEGVEGFVIDVGWRSTRLRGLANNVVVLPNQAVARATITNYNLPEPRMALGVKVSVDHSADPDRVEALLIDEVKRAVGQVPGLLGDPEPEVRLIPGFGEYSLDFTVGFHVAKFVDQYFVQHELRKRIVRRLRVEGVTIPVPVRAVQLSSDELAVSRRSANPESPSPLATPTGPLG
jgi:small-conductance mechanosensitive channel